MTSFENGTGFYTTKPPSNGAVSGDPFLHYTRGSELATFRFLCLAVVCIFTNHIYVFSGSLENFRMTLVKTRNYVGWKKYEEPPRTMGDGFVILQTACLDFSHAQDQLGAVQVALGFWLFYEILLCNGEFLFINFAVFNFQLNYHIYVQYRVQRTGTVFLISNLMIVGMVSV